MFLEETKNPLIWAEETRPGWANKLEDFHPRELQALQKTKVSGSEETIKLNNELRRKRIARARERERARAGLAGEEKLIFRFYFIYFFNFWRGKRKGTTVEDLYLLCFFVSLFPYPFIFFSVWTHRKMFYWKGGFVLRLEGIREIGFLFFSFLFFKGRKWSFYFISFLFLLSFFFFFFLNMNAPIDETSLIQIFHLNFYLFLKSQ